jgi:ABC-type dipeptide/oligopeptide/nickel transport system permease component
MSLYIVRRAVQGLGFILVAWLLVYTVLVVLMPGGPGATYRAIEQDGGGFGQANYLADRYKVDRPWPVNFLAWLFDPTDTTQFVNDQYGNTVEVPEGIDLTIGPWRIQGSGLLTLDLGNTDSLGTDGPVGEMLSARWPNTALLLLASMVLAAAVSLPVGIMSAVRHRSRLDHTLTLF